MVMERQVGDELETEICIFPDGRVVFMDLHVELLPVLLALNPNDERLKERIAQLQQSNVFPRRRRILRRKNPGQDLS